MLPTKEEREKILIAAEQLEREKLAKQQELERIAAENKIKEENEIITNAANKIISELPEKIILAIKNKQKNVEIWLDKLSKCIEIEDYQYRITNIVKDKFADNKDYTIKLVNRNYRRSQEGRDSDGYPDSKFDYWNEQHIVLEVLWE